MATTLRIKRIVTSSTEMEAGKTVVTTSESEDSYEFGDGIEWSVRDLFLVFNDTAGKRLVFHVDFVREFEFSAPY